MHSIHRWSCNSNCNIQTVIVCKLCRLLFAGFFLSCWCFKEIARIFNMSFAKFILIHANILLIFNLKKCCCQLQCQSVSQLLFAVSFCIFACHFRYEMSLLQQQSRHCIQVCCSGFPSASDVPAK